MSDATPQILPSYGKPYEFNFLDRKVCSSGTAMCDVIEQPSLEKEGKNIGEFMQPIYRTMSHSEGNVASP